MRACKLSKRSRWGQWFVRMSCLCLLWPIVACNEEEPWEAYRQDFAELRTDANGFTQDLKPDGDTWLAVLNKVGGLTADSLYRVTATYIQRPRGVELYNLSQVLSPFPRTYSPNAIKTDPVHLNAIWSSGRYINLRLTLRTGGGTHYFGFCDEGIEELTDGCRKLRLTLLHNQNNDPTYYSRETFLSCPVYHYAGTLRHDVDSICLVLHTFEGKREHTFAY